MRYQRSCVWLMAGAVALSRSVGISVAADADVSGNATSGTPAEHVELQEIIVNAQRRDESESKVPVSITALPQTFMDDFHVEHLSDLASLVPGLYVSPPGLVQDSATVSIRGIASSNNAPTTQFYIDETPIGIRLLGGAGPSSSPQPLIFDLDRVEVLRGPQGALFGASAMGGAIRFITPQPNLSDASGFAKADFGYTQDGSESYEIGAAYGAPIVAGTAAFRVSAWYQSIGGFIDREDPFAGQITRHNANSPGNWVVRPALTVAPSEALTITPSLYYQHQDSQNPNSYWVTELPNTTTDRYTWGGQAQPMGQTLSVASLDVKYNIAGLTLQSDTSYLNRTENATDDFSQVAEAIYGGILNPTLNNFKALNVDTSSTNAWQEELRLSSQDPASRISWVAGAFFRRANEAVRQTGAPDLTALTELCCSLTYQQFNDLNAGGAQDYLYQGQELYSYSDFHTTDLSEALFGNVTAHLTTRLKLDVGLRVEHVVVEGQNEVLAGPLEGITYSSTTLPDQKATPVTPRVSLTYQYTNDDMVYASAAKGFRPGGGNPVDAASNSLCEPSLRALGIGSVPSSFNSDSLWSYEIGAKDRFFDKRLSVEASIFYIDWTGIQSDVSLPSCGESFTSNRGKAVSQGFDLQLAAIVVEGLKLGLSAGYANAYYPNASYGAPSNGVAPLLNAAGDKLVPTVPWTVSVTANYERDVSALWQESHGYLRGEYRWQGRTTQLNPLAADYNPDTSPHPDPAYSILNGRVGIVHGGLDLSAYVNNLTNSSPLLSLTNIFPGDPILRAGALQPRTFGVTAWYRF